MVIKLFHAVVAEAAMRSTRGTEYLTGHTVLDKSFGAATGDFFTEEDTWTLGVVHEQGNRVAAIVS